MTVKIMRESNTKNGKKSETPLNPAKNDYRRLENDKLHLIHVKVHYALIAVD